MKAPVRLRPSFWWPLAVFLVFTAAAVWAGFAFFERLKQEQKAAAAGTLTTVGKLKAEQIRYYFDRNQKFALSVARLLGQGEVAHWLRGGAPAMPEALRESLLLVLRNRGENALLILAPDASVRFSVGEFTHLTEDGRRLALRAMTESPPVTSDIYRGDPFAPEQALLDIFVPIQSTDGGRAVGVLVLRSDLAYLYALIQTWPVESPTAESVLVRLEGDHALFLNELRFQKRTALRMQVPFSASPTFPGWPSTAAARGRVGIWEARDYLDHAILAYTLPVSGPVPGWGMVVKMELTEVFAPVQQLKKVTVGVTAAFILFALLTLGSWLWLLERKTEREIAEYQRIVRLNEQLELAIAQRKQAHEQIIQLNTELRRHATQLEATNKELESFAYSVSHDLRAPLRGMDGFSQALLEDYAGQIDATGQDYLRRIRAGAQRMGQLIDDLLNLSLVTRSEMVVDPVDLTALARKAIAELQSQQAGRVVEWEVSDPLTARGDPRLLQLVLHNLLANALKFTGKCEHARIALGQAALGAEQVFFVRDNGAGFDMAYANRLFGAFQRLHSPLEFPGTGIGLATVQRIIRRHGGRVWAEAQPGKGATFCFTLETAK